MRCALCGREAEVMWAGYAVCRWCQEEIVTPMVEGDEFPDESRIARAVERRVQEQRAEEARRVQGVMAL